jgi:hypothetical protein
MTLLFRRMLCWLLLVSTTTTTLLIHAEESQNNCSPEFDKCVMNRDCCEGLSCVAGDWAVTTDSHCLSERSAAFNALTKDQKLKLLKVFYDHQALPSKRKSTPEVYKLYQKYSRMFAELIVKMEQKYDTVFRLPGEEEENSKDEL